MADDDGRRRRRRSVNKNFFSSTKIFLQTHEIVNLILFAES